MYFSEFRLHWQPLLAASLGLGLGSALGHYTMSLFGPALLAEFGWSKAQFALIGSIPLINLLFVPFAGRFTDRFGSRLAAIIGFTALPLGFLAFTFMQGSIAVFFAIWVVQHIFGILTTSLVFCRVIVERFDSARGIALSLVMTAPPLFGAIAAPLLGALIDAEGWRAGYLAMAAITGAGGLIAIIAMGRSERKAAAQAAAESAATKPKIPSSLSGKELGALLRHPTLILIIAGMFLVNIPGVFASSQLKLVVMDNGVSSANATWMMSLYAIGVIIGRFLSGLALDRVPAHLVAIATLGLPAIGYLVLASHITTFSLLALGVGIIGFAQGAESDVGAFLISRRFDMKNFSLLLSLLTTMIGAGTAAGSVILSIALHNTGSYVPFLLISAVATILGALLFALTGSRRARKGTPEASVEDKVIEQAMAGEIG
ncbi:MFS transporter [Sphingobium sufflavum]|uniref:MFS transporter n=1 Tax=Sphingobium sufflavum TaxID=1129547 RepID=UPI001F31B5CC|nr:MFS transporter [Sphingobium sufflavum]MCE7795549.1 MFS transporter [Sphingobium sufflavum]